MIPQLIEKKIIDAISAALSPVAYVIGDNASRAGDDASIPTEVDGDREATPSLASIPTEADGDREATPSLASIPTEVDGGREAVESRLPIQIFGAWQPSAVGYLKNQEEAASVATIAVALGTQSRDTFSTSVVSFSGSIVLSIRAELDATGSALLALAAPIEALLREWQGATYQSAFTALDVPGFSVGDVKFSGGRPPEMNFAAKTITLDWPFTLSGCDAE